MTETEKAIQAFEISSENPMHEGCAMPYYAVVEPAFETALAALREKQEREKGCRQCNDKRCTSCRYFGWEPRICKECVDQSAWRPTPFCATCGKKLEEQKDG